MITLGVTGGIGSGKTTVCRLLESHGARVFYADLEAKRLMAEHPGLRADLLAAFGPEAFGDGGRLDRAHIAAQVFGDAARLNALNALVHPRVYEAFSVACARASAEGVWLFVKEAAILFETGGEKHLDFVAVVDAPLDVRLRRVMDRDRTSLEAVQARVQHQLDSAELRRRADFIIENSSDAAHLEREVAALVETLRASAPRQPHADGIAPRSPTRP